MRAWLAPHLRVHGIPLSYGVPARAFSEFIVRGQDDSETLFQVLHGRGGHAATVITTGGVVVARQSVRCSRLTVVPGTEPDRI